VRGQDRRRRDLARLPWALPGCLVVGLMVLAGCSTQIENGYVESPDGRLSFRHPIAWQDVGLESSGSEWVAGVDASTDPSTGNRTRFLLEEPFVVAEVYPLTAELRDVVSLSSLVRLAMADHSEVLDADESAVRILSDEDYLDDQGFQGHLIRFEIDVEGGTAVEEHFAVFDPERRHVQRIRVACSAACFESNSDDIESLFDSVRLRP
jgi:hypothetical protein